MKLAYERPVMRAEMFPAHAYCEEPCNWKLIEIDKVKNAILKATVAGMTFFFDAFSQQNRKNDGTGAGQHYFLEYTPWKDNTPTSTENACWNGVDVHADGIENDSVYFLEWSNTKKDFFVYQDMGNSGYYKDGEFTPGTGVLQVNGGMTNGGVSNYQGDGDYDTYRSDKNVSHNGWWGEAANVSYLDGDEMKFGFSG